MSFWKDSLFASEELCKQFVETPDNVTGKGSHVLFTDCSQLECYEAIMNKKKKTDIEAKHDK